MDTPSAGDSNPVLTFGRAARELREASAFGTSMSPSIKAGAVLRTEPVSPHQVKKGDVLIFEVKSGLYITHRVVKVSESKGQRRFLTKGDRQWLCDAEIQGGQILGRVTHVGGKNIRTALPLLRGRVIAWFSYLQGLVCAAFVGSRLNQGRLALEKRGVIPKMHLRRRLRCLWNPFWLRETAELWQLNIRFFLMRRKMTKAGFQTAEVLQPEPERMTQLWNCSFPAYATTPARFEKRVCAGPFFEKSFFYVFKKKDELAAWALVSLVSDQETNAAKKKAETAAIRVFAADSLTEEELLFFWDSLFRKVKQKVLGDIVFSSHPVQSRAAGLEFNRILQRICESGFKPVELCVEWLVRQGGIRFQGVERSDAVEIRPWSRADDEGMRSFLACHQVKNIKAMYGGIEAIDKSGAGIFLAEIGGEIAGYCRWLSDEAVENCGELTWMWAARELSQHRGYIVRLFVAPAFRRRGVGSLLVQAVFENFKKRGCEEMSLIAVEGEPRESFYKRLGFEKEGYFIKLKWSRDG